MRKSILIVDDDRAIAELTALWLKNAGHDAQCAFDGEAALAIAATVRPDLIVLDLRMPGMDGLEVQSRLNADPKLAGVPIIFLSANVQETARGPALGAGAQAFVSKPFRSEELLDAVDAAFATVLTGELS